MTDLIRMTRADGAIADVRPDWVDEWAGRGWKLPDAEPDDLTRDGIAKMPKAEILKLLPDADEKLPVAELRALLIATMFPDA